MIKTFTTCLFLVALIGSNKAQTSSEEKLLPPILLKNEQRLKGNPLATYQAMLEKEKAYLDSPFSEIYKQQKLNLEQFMGSPDAGKRAMSLILKDRYGSRIDSISENFMPKSAISVIEEAGKNHQVIIWGEEHHLPQTRVLYKKILETLWEKGFRYLAAETFTALVEQEGLKLITPDLGYYLQDPIFADAITYALNKGYKLIAYESRESNRDKGQAENIYNKIFKDDPLAKVFIIAGRAHIVEHVTTDGWEPMGYWLKQITGLDPFTLFAQRMTNRLTEDELHPLYKFAIKNDLLKEITIFHDSQNNNFLTSGNDYDAYVFFPQTKLIKGRSDWIFKTLNRRPIEIPNSFLDLEDTVLIQAHPINVPVSSVPVDQLLVYNNEKSTFLALPKGEFKIRSINAKDEILAEMKINID